jgi:hypothetical protein
MEKNTADQTQILTGFYLPVNNGDESVLIVKMNFPKKTEGLPLDHSDSNFVAFMDINPQFKEN